MDKKKLKKLIRPFLFPLKAVRKHYRRFCASSVRWNSINDVSDRPERLFIECTHFHDSPAGGGIDRVVSKVIQEMKKITEAYAVYCDFKGNFFYCDNNAPLKFKKGDSFLILDGSWEYSYTYEKYFKMLVENGVKFFTFIHDLIPLQNKATAVVDIFDFKKYVEVAAHGTGIITNSKYVLDCVKKYLEENPQVRPSQNLIMDYSHLGSDLSGKASENSKDIPDAEKENGSINFLMVSTVEPRKKYDQVVLAFEKLWNEGNDFNLTIVGKPGWKNEETIKLIRGSRYLDKKLFWLDSGISDDELDAEYKKSDALIMASIAEGFGLALYEAAFHKKPLIIRDIEVFREVAGENAFYFAGTEHEKLAERILEWVELYKENRHPLPEIRIRSWYECARQIYEIMGRS